MQDIRRRALLQWNVAKDRDNAHGLDLALLGAVEACAEPLVSEIDFWPELRRGSSQGRAILEPSVGCNAPVLNALVRTRTISRESVWASEGVL